MTVQMIRRDVRNSGDIRSEIHNAFQLKGTHLTYGHGLFLRIQRFSGKRISNISHYMRIRILAL